MTVNELDSVVPIRRRSWGRRLRGWRPWLITGGLVFAAAFAAWVVFFSSWLGLRTIQVNGAHGVSAAQVTAAAQVAPGTPLARINLEAVEARVESIPVVASATAHRGWPHTIVITLTERQPVAVTRHDGNWWLMDKTGLLFSKTTSRDPAQPIVELDGTPGPETLPQVASVLGSLPPALLSSTRRVTASSIDSISLILKDGSEVRWGSASDSAQKVTVLDALLHHKASVYDVSIPSQPATRS